MVGRRRQEPSDRVTILIPAYMAESFIDRTLWLARGQTHANTRIVVSVDAGTDDTAAVVHSHVAQDERVCAHVQPQRMGWAANVNFLLDQVDSPFAFLYFHDDLIVPQYTERLLAAAQARPDAATVHCDMGHFGGRDDVAAGRAYEGSATQRLLEFFLAPHRGSALRSLLRTDLIGSVRMPTDAVAGLWANEPFLMRLLAAGPALRVDDVLYHRWDKRSGGLTDGWLDLSADQHLDGWRINTDTAIEIVTAVATNDAERNTLLAALLLRTVAPLLVVEERTGEQLFETPADIHPEFGSVALPPVIDGFGTDVTRWADDRWQSAQRRKPSLTP